MSNTAITIAIADDHPIVRKGIIEYVGLFQGFEVIIEASDGNELLQRLTEALILPDICILDISMPVMNGYQTLKEIRKKWASLKILVFSIFYTEFSVSELFANGANGILKKNCTPQQLQQALEAIYYNEFYMKVPNDKLCYRHYKSHLAQKITEREMEFLGHCCSELCYKEIADLMDISARTVDSFRDALFTKLQIKTRSGLVMFALQNGIVYLEK